MMTLAAWYHIYADGAWQGPLGEFLEVYCDSGCPAPMHFGIVGSEEHVDRVRDTGVIPYAMAAAGNESVTINALRVYAQTHDGAVLYAHTKGAHDNTDFRARWRRSMTNRVVARWRENLALLETGDVDAVGCHWLTEEVFGADMFGQTLPPFFGGNFWMATTAYLRTLPPCPPEPRWEAERWIGLNNPRVVDLLPGWPHDNRWPELCT